MNNINKAIQESILYQLLGENGIDILREKIIDVIVNEIKDQLQSSSNYIVSPDDIANDLYNEVCESVKSSVTDEYQRRITEIMNSRIERLLSN